MRSLLLVYVCMVLVGCDLFGEGGVACFAGASVSSAPIEEIPGKIVFSATQIDSTGDRVQGRMDDGRVYVLEEGRATALTAFDFAINPSWSPDGEQIVFANGHRATTAGPNLYLMEADGSRLRPLKKIETGAGDLAGWDPAWSPDGNRIAFSYCLRCERGEQNYEIFVAEDLSDRAYDADDVSRLTNEWWPQGGPVWSPAGGRILFSTRPDPASRGAELHVMHADGSNPRRLYRSGDAIRTYAWAPSGGCVAVSGEEGLLLLDVETGEAERLEIELPEGVAEATLVDWPLVGRMLLVATGTGGHADPHDTLLVVDPRTGATLLSKELEGYHIDSRADWFVPQISR